MSIEHKNITDPNIHDLKGYGAALVHTSPHKAPDGAGYKLVWTYAGGIVYGEMDILGNTTAKAMTAAVDPTLNTNTDYVKMSGAGFPWAASHQEYVTFTGSDLVIQVAGTYMINFWSSIKVAAINTFIGVKYSVNNTIPYSVQKIVGQSTTANDIKNLSASGIIANLAVGDTISLYLASTATTNVTVQDAGMIVSLMHELMP